VLSHKALIVGPNVGVSMGKGGGVRVATKMAEALAENSFFVYLSALKGYPLNYLGSIHNTNLVKHRGKIQTHYLVNLRDELEKTKTLSATLPIHVGVLPFLIYLKYVIKRFSPHILLFHDDIPLFVRNEVRKQPTFLYVHFSYATRLKLGVGDIAEITMASKQHIERLLNPLLRKLIFMDNNPADIIVANSSVTASFLKQTWNRSDVVVLPPPVDTNLFEPSLVKENLVVALGSIQPNKRFGDVIKAINMVSSECRLIIIGHYSEAKYYHELLKLIKGMRLEKKVRIVLDASQRRVRDTLSRAKIIVHASQFEPFGIAVVEGMASGCVPIVYDGTKSGPWVDIINKGEFGLGFRTINDLSRNIEKILCDEKAYAYYGNKAKGRSKRFDTGTFKHDFMRLLKCTGL